MSATSGLSYLLIAAGSAIGGVTRHWLGLMVAEKFGTQFPWGTLLVNVTGSFLIGFIAALTDARTEMQGSRDFLMVGLLGGFTTFSAFSLQTLALLREDRLLYAGGNVALSVVICLIAVWLGHLLGNLLRPVTV